MLCQPKLRRYIVRTECQTDPYKIVVYNIIGRCEPKPVFK